MCVWYYSAQSNMRWTGAGMIKRYSKEDEKFFRTMMFPEELRSQYTSARWDGSYRWFQAPNIVCFEHYRRWSVDQISQSNTTGALVIKGDDCAL